MGAPQQFVRFALVGFASNLLGYVLYIALTKFGLDPKLSMSLLYCTGGFANIFFNNKNGHFVLKGSTIFLVR
ncbi:MAG: hypothetical protein IPP57_28050 [Candidatus Obscuribacter sp.]|nr:hypothetical protein [Candidatus Obscuribacter sp.]